MLWSWGRWVLDPGFLVDPVGAVLSTPWNSGSLCSVDTSSPFRYSSIVRVSVGGGTDCQPDFSRVGWSLSTHIGDRTFVDGVLTVDHSTVVGWYLPMVVVDGCTRTGTGISVGVEWSLSTRVDNL